MAVTIGSAPAYGTARMAMTDHLGKEVVKTFQFDGAALADVSDDTPLQQVMEDLDALTNTLITNAFLSGQLVSGLKGAAIDAIYPRINDILVLTFTQTNPINSAKTVTKTFLIPAPVEAIIGSGGAAIIGTSGEGSAPARLARLIGNLENLLIYIAADGSINVGGWGVVTDECKLA